MANKLWKLFTRHAVFLISSFGMLLFASSATPEPVRITQPDGTHFTAYIRGDERGSWHETLDGYSVFKNRQDGYWEYATRRKAEGGLAGDGLRVGKVLPPAKAKNLRPVKRDLELPWSMEKRANWDPQHELGTRNLLVVLVSFTDRDFTTSPQDWNQVIFGTSAEDKSVRRFYRENSFQRVGIEPVSTNQPGLPQGLVRIQLNRPHPNYAAGDDFPTALAHNDAETGWINEALTGISPYVDFPAYDANKNGRLTTGELNVYFILAGFDASISSKEPNIWAHAWAAFRASGIRGDGMLLENWALSGELHDSEQQNPFGVIAHELGHSIFGLPDLYDTGGVNAGLGFFSVMANGSFGRLGSEPRFGMTPGPMDAWSRYYLGWSEPRTFSNAQIADFPPGLSRHDAPVILPVQESEEFFMVENLYPDTIWHEGLRTFFEQQYAKVTLTNTVEPALSLLFSPTGRVTGKAVRCGLGKTGDFPASVAGEIALIQRGEITFNQKVTNAKAAGAIGVIVFNNQAGVNSGTLGMPGDYVPAVTTSPQGETLEGKDVEVLVQGFPWQGGLMVLHVDPTNPNNINNSTTNDHQGVVLEEANGLLGSLLDSGVVGHGTHLFYGGNNDRFTDDSSPGSRTYNGEASGVGLTQISAPGSVMTARITRDARLAYVVPWVVDSAQWSSRVAFFNDGDVAESPLVVAVDREGNEVAMELQVVGPKAVAVHAAASLFPGMNGYSLRIYASETVYPSFLTFNLDAPSGASPAQTTGMNADKMDERLVFGFLPQSSGGTGALVLLAPEAASDASTTVTLNLYDGNGLLIGDQTVELEGARPLATVLSDLFSLQVEEAAVVATAEPGVLLAGTTFAFNAALEPAMSLPFPSRANNRFAMPWIVSNASWSSRIALFNAEATPANVQLTATDRLGLTTAQSVTIPGNSLWSSESGDAFPGISGYSLLIDSDQTLYPSFLAFNLEAASQRSPAQTTGAPLAELNNQLVFPYVPYSEGGLSALVLTAPENAPENEEVVSLSLFNSSGAVLETQTVTLTGAQPLAAVISDLFDTPPEPSMTVTASGGEGVLLAGTTFVFNGAKEPSMSQAFSPKP